MKGGGAPSSGREARQLLAARRILEHVASKLALPISVRLWNDECIPLGPEPVPGFELVIANAGVLGRLLRRPTLENLLRLYASGGLDYRGADAIAFLDVARERRPRRKLRGLSFGLLLREALPLLLARSPEVDLVHRFRGDDTGRKLGARDERDFIQFHYDAGNDFYGLFLDSEMQYSCAYFEHDDATLDEAQRAKLDMICRKLQLSAGERLLDIGCGWGGLVCHAARNYGVSALGVTLSQAQYEYARAKVRRLGLEDRVRIELRDYREIDPAREGPFDKIASIGMYEHVGIAGYPEYFRSVRALLRDRGLFLNHGITRRAKRRARRMRRIRSGRRLILKYVFPGSELDHIGHTLESMEAHGFEISDVEGWRDHYARTCRLWCQRLSAREAEAIKAVGVERYRLWVAYLAGVSVGFHDGSLRIFQTVAVRHDAKGPSGMPWTRAHLYR